MPSNRSNSERCKAFDIDTKIEYMNKLYEVRESRRRAIRRRKGRL